MFNIDENGNVVPTVQLWSIFILIQFKGTETQEKLHQNFSREQVLSFMRGKEGFEEGDLERGAFEYRNGEQRVVYHFVPQS